MQNTLVPHQKLQEYVAALFASAGVSSGDAALIARGLVTADLRGQESHGVARAPIYLRRIREGLIAAKPAMKRTSSAPAAVFLDAANAMGFVAGHRAVADAAALAKQFGIAAVGVRNSNHFGIASLYAMQGMAAGCITMVYANSTPSIPVWGGRTPFLGTSPLAVGIPGGKEVPYLLDIGMSVAARGKMRIAMARGESIPEGLALDPDGNPTTDPAKALAGTALPFGGVKGAGIAVMVDLLAGAFTGAHFGGSGGVRSLYDNFEEMQDTGHLFLCMKADLFMPMEQFAQRMDDFVRAAKDSPKMPGVAEILMPGELESRKAADRMRNGLPLAGETADSLREESGKSGVPYPF